MARAILTVLIVILLNVLVGCAGVDTGQSQLMPPRTKTSMASAPVVEVSTAGESDIVEQVAVNRQAYRQGLELLEEYYTKGGDNMKLMWVKKELAALNRMPQYNYIIEAGVARPDLKAGTSIPEADALYEDGRDLEKMAGPLIIVRNDNLLRRALDKYNQLIRKYPSSDKIDDAAYRAAQIYEYFKDYSIAVLYFKRVYQWDPETVHPARFRQAFILDQRLHRRAEALEIYQQALKAVKSETEHKTWQEKARQRIAEITKADQETP